MPQRQFQCAAHQGDTGGGQAGPCGLRVGSQQYDVEGALDSPFLFAVSIDGLALEGHRHRCFTRSPLDRLPQQQCLTPNPGLGIFLGRHIDEVSFEAQARGCGTGQRETGSLDPPVVFGSQLDDQADRGWRRLRSVRLGIRLRLVGGLFVRQPFGPCPDCQFPDPGDTDDRFGLAYGEGSVVVPFQDLRQCGLARQVADGGILLVVADHDIQDSGKPRLGFFDRKRSRDASDHAFDTQHDLRVAGGQFRSRGFVVGGREGPGYSDHRTRHAGRQQKESHG